LPPKTVLIIVILSMIASTLGIVYFRFVVLPGSALSKGPYAN